MAFDQWVPLATQIPIVVAFVIFTTWMLRAFLDHLKELTQAQVAMMESERKQRVESMATGLREVAQLCAAIDKMAAAIGDNTKSLVVHNTESTARHHHLLDTLNKPRP